MQRRALVVGFSQYNKVSLGNFVSFANNANAIADILESTFKVKRLPEAVDGDRVRVGKSAVTCDRLQNELKELFTATDLDVVLFYFSGHGLKGKQLFPRTYLAASDSEGLDDGYRRAFEIEDLKNLLKNCPAREQIVWLDCCYGGDLANFAEVCDRNDGKTRFIITASRSQDPAYQEIAGEMGVFTRVLVSALARNGTTERRITCAAIEDAVREKLQSLQYPQMPQFYRTPNKIIEFWDRRVMAESQQDEEKNKVPEENNAKTIQKALENVSAGRDINVQINQNIGDRGNIRDKPLGENKPIVNSVKQLRIEMLQKNIRSLQEDYQAVYNQLDYTQSDVDRVRLKRQIANIERELEEKEGELNSYCTHNQTTEICEKNIPLTSKPLINNQTEQKKSLTLTEETKEEEIRAGVFMATTVILRLEDGVVTIRVNTRTTNLWQGAHAQVAISFLNEENVPTFKLKVFRCGVAGKFDPSGPSNRHCEFTEKIDDSVLIQIKSVRIEQSDRNVNEFIERAIYGNRG